MSEKKESANDTAAKLAAMIQGEPLLQSPPVGYASVDMVAKASGLSQSSASSNLLSAYKRGLIDRVRVRTEAGRGEYWYSDTPKSR